MKRYFLGAMIFFLACAVSAQTDYRTNSESKLQAAKQHIQSILDEDARPKRGFYGREIKFPMWKDQAYLDCASQMIVRAIEPKEPYFEDKQQRVVIVPVWAELLLVQASQSGGPGAAMDGSLPSMCAFEYERWSFERKRFEKVEGFRSRVHYDEFPRWGESVINDQINRWVSINLDKRYVRFLTRVSVVRDLPYQLGPQFPVHYPALNAWKILQISNARTIQLLSEGKSDRDPSVKGEELDADLVRMKWQLKNKTWAAQHLGDSLKKLENIKSFEEIQP
ncbi:MAG: hypothetical protein ACRERX_14390 [Pseudomonas sp.]